MNPIITDAHGVVCRWRNKRASDGGLVGAVVSDRYMDQLASMKPFDEPDGGRKFSLGAMLVQHVCVCQLACLSVLVCLSSSPCVLVSTPLSLCVYVSVLSYLCSRQMGTYVWIPLFLCFRIYLFCVRVSMF